MFHDTMGGHGGFGHGVKGAGGLATIHGKRNEFNRLGPNAAERDKDDRCEVGVGGVGLQGTFWAAARASLSVHLHRHSRATRLKSTPGAWVTDKGKGKFNSYLALGIVITSSFTT